MENTNRWMLPLKILLVLILLGGTIKATFLITRNRDENRFSSAIADQQTLAKITAAVTPDYSNLSEQVLYNFSDQTNIVVQYPKGFMAYSWPILSDTISLYPAIGGSASTTNEAIQKQLSSTGKFFENYMHILPTLYVKAITPDSYQQILADSYTQGDIPHQKNLYDVFAPDYSKPFASGYQSKKLGDYTCYYYNSEEQNPAFRLCHLFGKNHQLDIMYRTTVPADELGPDAPAFTTNNAEAIIAGIQFSDTSSSVPPKVF